MKKAKELIKKALLFSGLEISTLGLTSLRIRRLPKPVTNNYDLSVILPFYKKLEEFKKVLPLNAPYFQRNGIEVIIVLDEPTEEAGLIELLKSYPFINWRLIVNDIPHPWRNPAKAINVGIRHAERSKVIVMSPESILKTDAIKLLAEYVASHPSKFATGIVRFEFTVPWLACGSICAKREVFEAVGGYDEAYTEWGADDDDVRVRLTRAGYKGYQIISAKLLHIEAKRRPKKVLSNSSKQIYDSVRSSSRTAVNGDEWGRDFSRISLDYRRNIYAKELCESYLKTLKAYAFCELHTLQEAKKVVALIQSHHNPDINETLEHVSRFADGIILLDDGSTDGTFEKASHYKLLIKAQKTRIGFNDLENRNILLNIASFLPAEWLYFIDTDERIDDRFETPHEAAERDADILHFQILHLWNEKTHYRLDYPHSNKGVCARARMFRNIGRSQILSTKKLHFQAVPYSSEKVQESKIVIQHHGHLLPEARRRKFEFYTQQDINRDQGSYRHFLDEEVVLGSIEALKLD